MIKRLWIALFASTLGFYMPTSLLAEHGGDPVDGPVHTLEAIHVTAEKIYEYVKNHPQNVVVLTEKEIQERNFLELGEALDSMPGVDVTQRSGSMSTRISIRGGPPGPVLVLVDGRPVNSSQWGGVDLSSLPIQIVKEITVFKPPVPVWLGPGSSSGAINIVTNRSPTEVPQKKKRKARLKIQGGSYGAADINGTLSVPQQQGKLRLTAGGGHRDGKRANSNRDSGHFSFHWSRMTETKTQYDLSGRYYHANRGSSGPIDNPTPDARQQYRKGSIDLHLDGYMGDSAEYTLQAYSDVEYLKDRSQTGDISALDLYKFGLNGETVITPEEGDWALRMGGLVETDRVDHTITGAHHRDKISLHLQHDMELNAFTASLGLRGDYTNDFGLFPALRGGVSYPIGEDIILKGNAGYTVKIPTFNQLYQPSHGSIDQVRGNPNLTEQDIYTYDLGVEHRIKKEIVLNVGFFRTTMDNLISYDRDVDLIYRPRNIARAYKQGLEMSLKSKLSERISVDVSYVYQDTKDKGTGYELTYSPAHNAKITGKFTLPTRTKVEAILKAVSEQQGSLDNDPNEELDAYTVVHLKMVQPCIIKTVPCDLFVHFYNLFDSDFQSHAGYPDDGFRVMAGLSLNF